MYMHVSLLIATIKKCTSGFPTGLSQSVQLLVSGFLKLRNKNFPYKCGKDTILITFSDYTHVLVLFF